MQDYKKLEVWEKAHSLTVAIYKITETFPKDELYGLTSQIRRASVSVPSNIAEGCSREGKSEFVQFLKIALGSANELEYQIFLSRDLKFITDEVHNGLNEQIDHVRRMLVALIKKVKENPGNV